MNAGRLGWTVAAVLFSILAVPICRAKEPSGPESAAIKDTVAQLANSFNHHDASAWAAVFAEDADFTNIGGVPAHGRKAIEQFMAPLFSGVLKNVSGTYTVRDIRMLTPTLAEVDVDTAATLSPSAPPNKGLTSLILSKQKRQWLILVFHEQDFPSRAPAPPPRR